MIHVTQQNINSLPLRYLTNRMNTYSLSTANKEKERIIKHILQNNKYDVSTLHIPSKR